MTPKISTQPPLELTPQHIDALKQGKDFFKETCQNVIDEYKGLSVEEIKKELAAKANPFAVCFENILGDFNMSTGIRNANAFNAKEVFYIGNKKWDRRGSVGAHSYTEVNFLPTVDSLLSLKDKYIFIGVDNIPGSVPMETYQWQPNSMLIFGEEGCGLTKQMQSLCKDVVHITMFGSIRSMNIGCASAIAMYDFVKNVKKE